MTKTLRALALALMAPALVSSCDSVENGGLTTTRGYTFTIPASIVNLKSGTTTTVPVSITRYGDFTGPVTFTAEGVPTGLTVTFTPSTIPTGETLSSLTITVAASAAANSYPFTIRSTAASLEAVITPVPVSVTPPVASIALSAPATATIQAGKPGQAVTIGIARTNFVGDVTLAVTSNVPTGFTAPIVSSPTAANSAIVTFAATVATAPGTYTVVLQGTGPGLTPQSVSIVVTVTAATPIVVR